MAFSSLSRGASLAEDYKNYKTWLEQDTQKRQQSYAAITNEQNRVKIKRSAGYIAPFDSNTIIYLPARIIDETQGGRGGDLAIKVRNILKDFTFTPEEVKAVQNANIIDGAKKFKFATLTLKELVTRATQKSASRITKRQYNKHEYDSVTGAFGRSTQIAATYDTIVTAIRADQNFTQFIGINGNRYSFKPEGV